MITTAMKLFSEHEKPAIFSLWRGTGLAAWLAGYTAAWSLSVLEMFRLYSTLPVNPPQDCYIATASSRGHPCLVQSSPVLTDNGIMWVTPQLQYSKCAELALRALAPGLHRLLRAFYDVVGPVLARRITHPLLADLVYVSLKPFEWLSRWFLRLLIPDLDKYVQRLYCSDSPF
jgi:hypothetical protein